MSTTNAVQKQQQPKQPAAISLLQNQQTIKEIQKALPAVFSPDRFIRIAMTELRKNQALVDCDPYSFLGAVIQSAQLGLEVGSGLGHAYLVPYGKECQLITGYKGITELSRRSGQISGIHAEVVHKEDFFEYRIVNGKVILNHEPKLGKKSDENIVAAYAIANFVTGGAPQIAVMSVEEIIEIRDTKARGSKRSDSPWRTSFGEMCKKTVVRRVGKMLPQSTEYVRATQIEDGEVKAHQPFVDLGIIDANYEPAGGHDPKKAAELQKEAHKAEPLEHEKQQKSGEQQQAYAEFCKAAEEYELNGGHVKNALVNIKPETIKDLEPSKIRAATAILVGLMKEGKYK